MEGRLEPVDQEFIRQRWEETWGLPVVSIDRSYMPDDVAGLVWRDEWGEVQGLITWHIDEERAELVTVDAYQQGRHIGGRLLAGAEAELRKRNVRSVTIVTTNDNLRAMAFYIRHGYRLVRIDVDGVERVRAIKPDVPMIGQEGIPLRDMFELQKDLTAKAHGHGAPAEVRPESFS